MGMDRPQIVTLTDDQRAALRRMTRSRSFTARMSTRARIVLARADGMSKSETARKVDVSEVTVQTWTDRFRDGGVEGLSDLPGRGRKPTISPKIRERIITQATRPPKGLLRHSTRSMAKAVGVSQHTVRLLWNKSGIKPHLIRTFKVSKDPNFTEKFWDVIGLYLNPPEKAIVFCCDEKTQCQALERTQPGLPLGIGHVRTKSHDYTRHGTTTLFAALDYLSGKVIHDHHQVHTHKEWIAFLGKIWRIAPRDVSIEIIADNYATHKHPEVKKWLEKHPRLHMHFTPTSSSWLNLVERFFGEITRGCIRDGSFTSVKSLEKAMNTYIAAHNDNPKRFVWKADGTTILEKPNRARAKLNMPPLPIEK